MATRGDHDRKISNSKHCFMSAGEEQGGSSVHDVSPSDPLQFKLQLENELRDVENSLERRTRKLQERLREVAQLQQTLHVPVHSRPAPSSNSPSGPEISSPVYSPQPNGQKEEEEHENGFLLQMKEKAFHTANERLELEQSKHRYQVLLDEERQASTQAKRKAKQLEAELIQLKKRLHQEMTASSQKDQKLQELQRKFPTLLNELERTETRCNQLAQDKDDLQQRMYL